MTRRGGPIAILACALAVGACGYVVVPPEPSSPVSTGSKGWTGIATAVGPAQSGDLRIELTIRNETGDWSEMTAVPGRPAVLRSGGGSTTGCATVMVGTGGHRLAPGFHMRGYVAGTKSKPTTELIRVECAGATAEAGSMLEMDYSYMTGDYNYYDPDATKVDAKMEVNLDDPVADLTYPVAEPIDGLVQPADIEITAINGVMLTLTDVKRTDTGLEFGWHTSNPGEYPTFAHIGNPPVIGADGILYGYYESPDLASVPATPAGDEATWTTEVALPAKLTGAYIMLSVESKKQRLFVHYAIDIGDR